MTKRKIMKFLTRTALLVIFFALLSSLHSYPEKTLEGKVITFNGKTIPQVTLEKAKELTDKFIDALKVIGYEKLASQDTSLEPVTVAKVVDGDTLYVLTPEGDEIKIRLIGIDTPESVHSEEEKNNIYGQMASEYTKELLKDVSTLYLEYDEEKTDPYDRVLAYVWLSEDVSDINNMLNAKLLSDGYAYNKTYGKNDKYADLFESLRIAAQDEKSGLWSNEDFSSLWNK